MAVPTLIEALDDSRDDVRGEAIAALGEIGSEGAAAVSQLIRFLHDPSSSVRGRAATALGKMGGGAREALPR
jgi:HEAT repeat protein